MKFKKKISGQQSYFILRILVGFVGLSVILCIFYLGYKFAKSENQSDKEIITSFNENKVEFQKLVEMARADSHIIRVDPNFIWTTEGNKLIK